MNISTSKILFTVEFGMDFMKDFIDTKKVFRDLMGKGIKANEIKRIYKHNALNYIIVDKAHEDVVKSFVEAYGQFGYLELDSNRGLHIISIRKHEDVIYLGKILPTNDIDEVAFINTSAGTQYRIQEPHGKYKVS